MFLIAASVTALSNPAGAQAPAKPQVDPTAAAQIKGVGDQLRSTLQQSPGKAGIPHPEQLSNAQASKAGRVDMSDENMVRVMREGRLPVEPMKQVSAKEIEPLMEGYFSSQMQKMGQRATEATKGHMIRESLPQQIIRHLVSSVPTNGLPIPPKPELVARAREQGAERAKHAFDHPQPTPTRDTQAAPPKGPQRCRQSLTRVMQTNGAPVRQGGEPPKVDLLFLDAPSEPLNVDELFGATTQVYTPGSGKDGDTFGMAVALGTIECLPYRIRVIGNQYFMHLGEDAVKFYTSSPSDQGKLQDGVKGKYW